MAAVHFRGPLAILDRVIGGSTARPVRFGRAAGPRAVRAGLTHAAARAALPGDPLQQPGGRRTGPHRAGGAPLVGLAAVLLGGHRRLLRGKKKPRRWAGASWGWDPTRSSGFRAAGGDTPRAAR